jgi:DNA-binding transcriptional ArsR family regulator
MGEPNPQDVRRATKIFKALSHPQRLRIVCKLAELRVATERELVEEFGLPQSTVNRHLSVLKECGVVAAQRAGTRVLVELAGPMAGQLMNAVCQWVHPETGERFSGSLAAIPKPPGDVP